MMSCYLTDAAGPNTRTMVSLFIYIFAFNLIVQSPRFVSSQHIRGDINNDEPSSEPADNTLQIRLPPKVQDVLGSNRVVLNRHHSDSDMMLPSGSNSDDNDKTNTRILFPTARPRYIPRARSTFGESSESKDSHSLDSTTRDTGRKWMRGRQSLFNPTIPPQYTSSEYNVNLFSPEVHVTAPEIPYGYKGDRHPFIPTIQPVFTPTPHVIHDHTIVSHETPFHRKGTKGGRYPFIPTIPPVFIPTTPTTIYGHDIGQHGVVTKHPGFHGKGSKGSKGGRKPFIPSIPSVFTSTTPTIIHEHDIEHHGVITEHPVIHGKGTKGGTHPPFIPTIPPEYVPTTIHENHGVVTEHPVVIDEHHGVVTEHPVVITEHPVVITEHPVVIDEHHGVVTEHPVVITQHPVIHGKGTKGGTHPPFIPTIPPEYIPTTIHENHGVVTEHPVVIDEHHGVVTEHPIVYGKGTKGGTHPPFIPTIPPEYIPTTIDEHHGIVTETPLVFHGKGTKGTKGGRHPFNPTIPPEYTPTTIDQHHGIVTETPQVFHGKGTKGTKGGRHPFNPTIPAVFSQTEAATVNDYYTAAHTVTDGYTEPTATNLPTHKEETHTLEIATTEPSAQGTPTQDYQETTTSSIDKTEQPHTLTPSTLDVTTHQVVIEHIHTDPVPTTDHVITTEPQSDELQKTTHPTFTLTQEIHKPTTIPSDIHQETTVPQFPPIESTPHPTITPGIVTTQPDIYQQTTEPTIHITEKVPTTVDTYTTHHDVHETTETIHQTTQQTPFEIHTTHTDDVQVTTDMVYTPINEPHKPTTEPSYDVQQTTEPVVFEHPPETQPPAVHITPVTPAWTEQTTIVVDHVPETTPPSVHITPVTPAWTEQTTIVEEHAPETTPPSVHITPVTPAWTEQTPVQELIPVVPQVPLVPPIIIHDDDQHQGTLPVVFPTDPPSIEHEFDIDERVKSDEDDDGGQQETLPLPDYNSGPAVIPSWHSTTYHGFVPPNHTHTIHYPLPPFPPYEFTVAHHPPTPAHIPPIQPIIPYHPVAFVPAHSVYTWSHQHAPNLPSTLSPQYTPLEQTDVKGHATYAANRPEIKGRGGQVDWETQKPLPIVNT